MDNVQTVVSDHETLAIAKKEFLTSWGELSTNWGVCKTMGQIHGLLLISSTPKCTDDIMKELDISRGNTHINIRALQDWNLVYKVDLDTCRKDYFIAEKDIWKVLVRIIQQRKERELTPLIELADRFKNLENDGLEAKEFASMMSEISMFSHRADQVLQNITSSESSWLMNSFMKLVR